MEHAGGRQPPHATLTVAGSDSGAGRTGVARTMKVSNSPPTRHASNGTTGPLAAILHQPPGGIGHIAMIACRRRQSLVTPTEAQPLSLVIGGGRRSIKVERKDQVAMYVGIVRR